MNEYEYTVRLIDLPVFSKGFVICDDDGHYNIYINARLNHTQQKETFNHELAHIINDDFYNADDIRTIEARAERHMRRRSLPKTKTVHADKPMPKPQPQPLTSSQYHLITNAIADLDRFLFEPLDFEY